MKTLQAKGTVTKSEILEGLNPEQIKAVTHGEGPLLIVAGAGTGKTTVITRRIGYLIEQGVKAENILALAFGDRAAAEMKERVDQLLPLGYYDLQISTFHAFCDLILREQGLEIGLPDFKQLDEVGQWLLVKNNLAEFDLDYYRPLGNPTRFIKALIRHFSRAKDELITPAQYLDYVEKIKINKDQSEAGLEDFELEHRRLSEVGNAYHVYQKLLLQNNFLDFGDLINYSLQLLQKRPKILELYRQKYKYILLDEFQDTNYAQYELIKLLAAPVNNLTVVGDDDQSIFKFRGASISNILHFQKDYADAKFISLTNNYRTGQKILDAAHGFIEQNNPDRLEVRLGVDKKLKNAANPRGELEVLSAPDYVSEARTVVDKIVTLNTANTESSWNNFAILARSHDLLDPFISALEEREISYIYFANKGLYKKSIIFDVIAYFELLDDYHESQALYRVANFPIFHIEHKVILELSHYAKKKTLSLFEAFQKAGEVDGLNAKSLEGIKKLLVFLDKHEKTSKDKSTEQLYIEVINDLDFARLAMNDFQNGKYLENFRYRIQRFQAEVADKSLKNFMRDLSFEQEAGESGELEFDPEAGPEAVKLMTVHAAKGLEFDTVFLVGLVDKRFPTIERKEPIEIPKPLIKDILPEGDIHLEEERRLFYVAMTRAKQRLVLSRAFDYGGKLQKKPSRFLLELGLTSGKAAKPTGKVVFKTLDKVRKQISLPLPKKFSWTQISTFIKCPLEYKYKFILNIPTPGSHAASFGSTIHNTLSKFMVEYQQKSRQTDLFGTVGKNSLPDYAVLENHYKNAWIDDWYPDKDIKKEYREKGKNILKTFYEDCQKSAPRPKFIEKRFELKLDGRIFTGVIDRADETADGLVIIDYKTGSADILSPVNKEQLLIYQWAANDVLKESVADLQYWYLQDRLEKQSFLGEPPDLEKLKQKIGETISEIILAVKSDDFYDRDLHGRSHECKFRRLIQ
jgi:DNA helicase-2/ATP-dependent DNA helicase PcrA